MATDPFVPPRLEDRPRNRQNLAPGSHYPPAEAWVARRPGDLPTGQPTGMLLGDPGPNIGFAMKLANDRAERLHLLPHESREDAAAVVAEVAMRRSARFHRAPTIHDVDFAITLFGYGQEGSERTLGWRRPLVHDAAHEWTRRRTIVDAIPERVLRMRPEELGRELDATQASLRGALESSAAAQDAAAEAAGA